MPGGRLSERVFVEPVKVGVAPSTLPAAFAIVTLCGSGDLLVKSIVTWLEAATSVFVL